jgi:hypothetical protein
LRTVLLFAAAWVALSFGVALGIALLEWIVGAFRSR